MQNSHLDKPLNIFYKDNDDNNNNDNNNNKDDNINNNNNINDNNKINNNENEKEKEKEYSLPETVYKKNKKLKNNIESESTKEKDLLILNIDKSLSTSCDKKEKSKNKNKKNSINLEDSEHNSLYLKDNKNVFPSSFIYLDYSKQNTFSFNGKEKDKDNNQLNNSNLEHSENKSLHFKEESKKKNYNIERSDENYLFYGKKKKGYLEVAEYPFKSGVRKKKEENDIKDSIDKNKSF